MRREISYNPSQQSESNDFLGHFRETLEMGKDQILQQLIQESKKDSVIEKVPIKDENENFLESVYWPAKPLHCLTLQSCIQRQNEAKRG